MRSTLFGTRPARWLRTTLLLAAAAVPAQPSTTSQAPATPPAVSPHGGAAPHAMPPHGMPPHAMPPAGHKPDPAQKPIPIPLPPTPKGSADLSKARVVKQLTVLVRHRVFANFAESIPMRKGDEVGIGDTDYTALLVDYVPDFGMDIETGKVFSRTDQPNNPAFKIIIKQKGAPTDTTWAFMNMPPHFARKSLLAFQVMRIDYTSGKPILAKPPADKSATGKTATNKSGAAK